MLRESVELTGGSIDFEGLTDPSCTEIKGVANSRELLQLANACMGVAGDVANWSRRARPWWMKMGPAAMIDTVGVISNFQRMVRIADATGIPADGPMQEMSGDLREQLGINQYVSAANSSRPSFLKRADAETRSGMRMFRKMIREASS